jgi:ABC-type uncharacterized transport system ATPase subunit
MKWLTSRTAAVRAPSEETCDDDVLKEEALVLSGATRSDMIVIKKLRKVYDDGKVAVDSLSLGIAPGECFGLLGINGENQEQCGVLLFACNASLNAQRMFLFDQELGKPPLWVY